MLLFVSDFLIFSNESTSSITISTSCVALTSSYSFFTNTLFSLFLFTFVRVTRVELSGESSVYKYTPEYVITHLSEESLENRIRLLEGYSILYIQVPSVTEYSEGQGQEYRSRQLIKCYIIIIYLVQSHSSGLLLVYQEYDLV